MSEKTARFYFIAFTLFCLALIAFNCDAVGQTTQPGKDIPLARPGETVVVAPGDYTLLGVQVPRAVTVRGQGKVIFRASGNTNQQILKLRSDDSVVDSITFAPKSVIALDVATCSNVTLRNITVDADYSIPADFDDGSKGFARVGGYYGIKVDGCTNLLIDGLNIPKQLSHYGITIMGRESRGVTIRNYTHHGSVHEHGLRTTVVNGLYIVNMRGLVNYADPGTKNVGALSIRNDGHNILVSDSELHGLGVGPQNTDPIFSITENVTFLRCALSLNVTHYGGSRLKNVQYIGCTKDGQPWPAGG